MQLSTADIEELAGSFGEVLTARQRELDITAEEDFAESDLVTAQEATTTKIDAFKALVAAKIQAANITILQEGDQQRTEGDTVTMPLSAACKCGD